MQYFEMFGSRRVMVGVRSRGVTIAGKTAGRICELTRRTTTRFYNEVKFAQEITDRGVCRAFGVWTRSGRLPPEFEGKAIAAVAQLVAQPVHMIAHLVQDFDLHKNETIRQHHSDS